MTDKPFKGEIHNWRIDHESVPEAKKRGILEPDEGGLGFIVWGDVEDHPVFGSPDWFRTSWVEKIDNETGEIETRNSRYRLVPPPDKKEKAGN